jgi:hypothetical protein
MNIGRSIRPIKKIKIIRMKRISIYLIFSFSLLACNKKEVVPLNFDVKTNKTSYNVNDTVRFLVSGNPDQLQFYSGMPGHQYIYKDRYEANGKPAMSFTYFAQYGAELNTLKLLVSQNFAGTYTQAGVAAATWTDITNRVTPAFVYNSDNRPSGTIDLSDFDQSKPLYIAFKFTGTTGATQRTWTIKNFTLNTEIDGGTVINVANTSTAAWTNVNFNNSPRNWTFTTAQLQFQGGAANIGSNEGWAVSKALYLNKVAPDKGVALKNMSTRMDEYSFIYTAPGTYTATFIASNENIYGASKSLKELTVTVQ